MTRYNFAAVMADLSHTFGWTNTELGVFETMMPLVYGLSNITCEAQRQAVRSPL